MDTLEYMRLVCGILTAVIGAGGFKMYIDRRKYIQEVEKLKADVQAAQVNTRGSELDNVQKAMQILMDQIVEPLNKKSMRLEKNSGNSAGPWRSRILAVLLLTALCAASCKSPIRLEKTTSLDSLRGVKRFALIQQPIPPSLAKTAFPTAILNRIPMVPGLVPAAGSSGERKPDIGRQHRSDRHVRQPGPRGDYPDGRKHPHTQ